MFGALRRRLGECIFFCECVPNFDWSEADVGQVRYHSMTLKDGGKDSWPGRGEFPVVLFRGNFYPKASHSAVKQISPATKGS